MKRRKITSGSAIAIAAILITSGAAFATTDLGTQFLEWAQTKVEQAKSELKGETAGTLSDLDAANKSGRTASKAVVKDYAISKGNEKEDNLEDLASQYIRDLEYTRDNLKSQVPKTFDELVAAINSQTSSEIDAKGNAIVSKIISDQSGFGKDLWSAQNTSKQILDRKIRVKGAELSSELEKIIASSKADIEALVNSEGETAKSEIEQSIIDSYQKALADINSELTKWEDSAKGTFDELAEEYYDVAANKMDEAVKNAMNK